MNPKSARISVLTTVNQGREFLEHCIESIQSQSFEHWEHIIVSDGAPKDVVTFLEGLSDPRQKTVFAKNIGRAKALNLGIQNCSTDLIAILDADDVSHPKRLEVQFNVMQNLPNASVLSSKCILSNMFFENIDLLAGEEFELLPESLLSGSPICHSAALIRKSALLAVGGYDEKIDKLVDLTLWKDFMVNKFKIYGNLCPLTYHRIHDGQSFEKRGRINYLYSAFKIRLNLIRELKISKIYLYKPISAFFYGLLPGIIRKKIKNILNY